MYGVTLLWSVQRVFIHWLFGCEESPQVSCILHHVVALLSCLKPNVRFSKLEYLSFMQILQQVKQDYESMTVEVPLPELMQMEVQVPTSSQTRSSTILKRL